MELTFEQKIQVRQCFGNQYQTIPECIKCPVTQLCLKEQIERDDKRRF